MQHPDTPTPRIYVASLSDYNAGRLHGVWIDATDGRTAIVDAIARMLATSREPDAEEWAIHDYENFGPVRLGEYESLDVIARLGEGIATHGPAFAHYAALVDPDWDQLAQYEDRYMGHWCSMSAYAGDLLDSLGVDTECCVPETLQPYVRIDTEAFARDLASELAISEGDRGVYVFEP